MQHKLLAVCLATAAMTACSFDASKLRYARDAGHDTTMKMDSAVGDDRDSAQLSPDAGGAKDVLAVADSSPKADGERPVDALIEDGGGARLDLAPPSGDGAVDGEIEPADGGGDLSGDAEETTVDLGAGGADATTVVDQAADSIEPDTGPALPDAAAPDTSPPDTAVPDTATGPDPDLVVWYRFDESGGATAYDSAMFGGVARNASLVSSGFGAAISFATQSRVGTRALNLQPSAFYPGTYGAYASIPVVHTLAPEQMTFAVWVYMAANTSTQTWSRIFDFGDSSSAPKWMNLVARDEQGLVRFAMSNTGHTEAQEQRLISGSPLTANAWHHIAIVFPPGVPFTGVMYIDGEVAASNTKMTLHGSDIGPTTYNYLGKSLFAGDPYFNGSLDDLRVYKRALTKQEIQALIALH